MLNQVLPRHIDSEYHGYKVALWIFGLLLLLKVVISFNSIFHGYLVATSADGIPLDTFPPAAAQTVVSLFALRGLSNFVICLIGILVLVRYRSAIPFMFALLLLDNLGKRLILHFLPIVRTGSPPGFYVDLILLALPVVGFALSRRWFREGDAR
jgi:hypothetical protein